MKAICLLFAIGVVCLTARPRVEAPAPPPNLNLGNVEAQNITVASELQAGTLIGPHLDPMTEYLTGGAIDPWRSGVVALSSPVAASYGMGAPSNDGVHKTIVSTTGAHVLTFNSGVTANFTGGAALKLVSITGVWYVESARGVTFE